MKNTEKTINIGVPGIHTGDPKKTIWKIGRFLDNFDVFYYGFVSVLGARFGNKKNGKVLKRMLSSIKGKINIYAHSNGNPITIIAAKEGAKIECLISLNAALKANTVFPENIKRVLVIYTKHDKATKAARFFDRLPFIGFFIPDSWGAMGALGSTSGQQNVTNFCTDDILSDHGDIFDGDINNVDDLKVLMPIIKHWIETNEILVK